MGSKCVLGWISIVSLVCKQACAHKYVHTHIFIHMFSIMNMYIIICLPSTVLGLTIAVASR